MVAMRSNPMDTDLCAVHVRTRGMYCEQCTARVECAVSSIPGVREVTAVRAMNLTSILYDRSRVDGETIARAIRGAGFSAEFASQRVERDDVPCELVLDVDPMRRI